MNSLISSCRDILYKNMNYQDEAVFLLYDTESPLSRMMSDAYKSVLPAGATAMEFINPPQPLYRGGMVNPDNPHTDQQNRIATVHNIQENVKKWLDHHEKNGVTTVSGSWLEENSSNNTDNEDYLTSIKNALISLPKGSIVILVQSTNFRLSTFRIRLELFHRGIHVVEHNHLAYIPEEQFETFFDTLIYRTPEYVRLQNAFDERLSRAKTTKIESYNGDVLTFGAVEKIRWNTGDYTGMENKGGTIPIGEVFTEAIDLDDVNWRCWIDTFPNEDFSISITEPFLLKIENGRVLPSPHFPPAFQRLYDLVLQFEGEVRVRELGFGLNPGVSTERPLRDINFHERKVGVHLSLGKKHGIYGKKLPKSELQRFHIDVFIAVKHVYIDDEMVFENNAWTL